MVNQFNIKIIIKFYQTIYILSIDYWALMFTSDWASPGVRLRLKKLARFGPVGKWAKFKFLETIMSHDIISWENHHIRWVGCDNNLEGSYTLISLKIQKVKYTIIFFTLKSIIFLLCLF